MTHATPFAELDAQGLNLQAVFNLVELPADVLAALPPEAMGTYRQLILIGHRGGQMWQQLMAQGMAGCDPIDSFSRLHIGAWVAQHQPKCRYVWLYPGPTKVNLQRLGQLAGWHYPSPFMVGINAHWGSWFAYRAVLLADTALPLTARLDSTPACASCATQVCVSACPAGALTGGFNLPACLAYRTSPQSACQDRCLARNACPVGSKHRYSEEQIRYHYGQSLVRFQQK